MTRQLAHHHNNPNPCPTCAAMIAELAELRDLAECRCDSEDLHDELARRYEVIADLRLALLNTTTERDVAQQEAASLPHPHYSPGELDHVVATVHGTTRDTIWRGVR